jgi:hypothetical protein
MPEWASATTAAQHRVRIRKTPYRTSVTAGANSCRRLRKAARANGPDGRSHHAGMSNVSLPSLVRDIAIIEL